MSALHPLTSPEVVCQSLPRSTAPIIFPSTEKVSRKRSFPQPLAELENEHVRRHSLNDNVELRKALSQTHSLPLKASQKTSLNSVVNNTKLNTSSTAASIFSANNLSLQQIMPHAGLLDKESLANLISLINLELLSASILQSGNPLMIGLLQQSVKGMNAVFENHACALNMPEHDSFSIKKILDTNSSAQHLQQDCCQAKSSPLRDLLATTSKASPSSSLNSQLTTHLQQHQNAEVPEDPSSRAIKMTTPKISRHNDAAYYPNIQCILCKEWVCSRNRYMHIESHLQYRPYKCSICGYDNRKEIFINLHIKKAHGDDAVVVYTPDAELEHSAWIMAEKCLQHTREVLSKKVEGTEQVLEVQDESSTIGQNVDKREEEISVVNGDKASLIPNVSSLADSQFGSMVEMPMFQPYATQYRPKIYNSQRAEKSQIIEASRMQGLIPDLSEVCNRETKCPMHDCKLQHHSKSFLVRHMKEVHKFRKSPIDVLLNNCLLRNEFEMMSVECFPDLSAKRRRRFIVPSSQNESIDHRQNSQKESMTTNLPHLTAALRVHETTKPSELESLLLQNAKDVTDRTSNTSILSSLLSDHSFVANGRKNIN